MDVSVGEICAYIEFLKKEMNLYVSLHGKIARLNLAVRDNIHLHPYCLFVKNKCNCQGECIMQQRKVISHGDKGDFFGVCYAGVGEFIYNIRDQDENFGFISVSGYRGDSDIVRAKLKKFAASHGISYEELCRLSDDFQIAPPKEKIDTLIRPLQILCTLYCINHKKQMHDGSIIWDILLYINEFYASHITMKDLSNKFNYSVSTLSHLFKRRTGVSLNKYIENLRVENAKLLLCRTELQITEIAMLLGFCSSEYFSTTFKKNTGVSPKDYRKAESFYRLT